MASNPLKDKTEIRLDDGTIALATAPLIVSASRSTDIPAFYADWFFERLKRGYSAWTNPFNGVKMYVSYEKTRFIVFWSKNPRKLLDHLDYLKERNIGCYIQYTLNDYEEEGLERGVPPLEERIDTFKSLVNRLEKGQVVWRFDPLLLTDSIDQDALLRKIENVGDRLYGYTEKLVFSFADISSYRKVKSNLEKNGVNYIEWTSQTMLEFAEKLAKLNSKWGYELATCGEPIDLSRFGIAKNKCVDDRLIVRLAYQDKELMKYLGATVESMSGAGMGSLFADMSDDMPEPPEEDGMITVDVGGGTCVKLKETKGGQGQRAACGCIKSKDIGEYNTCPHLCEYCYANSSKEAALRNWQLHKVNPHSETITGR